MSSLGGKPSGGSEGDVCFDGGLGVTDGVGVHGS